jgi:hypothetical protein
MDAVAAPDVAVLFLSAQTEAPPNFSITSQLQGRTDNLTRTDKFGHSQFNSNSFAFDGTTNIMAGGGGEPLRFSLKGIVRELIHWWVDCWCWFRESTGRDSSAGGRDWNRMNKRKGWRNLQDLLTPNLDGASPRRAAQCSRRKWWKSSSSFASSPGHRQLGRFYIRMVRYVLYTTARHLAECWGSCQGWLRGPITNTFNLGEAWEKWLLGDWRVTSV